jgi:DNA modification methylase
LENDLNRSNNTKVNDVGDEWNEFSSLDTVAKKSEREFIEIEKEPEYIELVKDRITNIKIYFEEADRMD